MTAASESALGALATLSRDLADAVERAAPSIVAIDARARIPSSGVLWRDGVVVTADHTIRREESISVRLEGGSTASAVLVGRDPSTDLAVLRLDGGAGRPAALGDGAALRPGHVVVAVGRPGADVTASFGIVSASSGEWRTWRGGRLDRFIRLDMAIHDGFSGGALVNERGAVVGVNTSGLARAQPITIPVSTVDRVMRELLEKGRVARGYLGLAMQGIRLPDAVAGALRLPSRHALMVMGVEERSPAADAGVMIGDVLLAFDDRALRDPADLLAALGPESVGHVARARVLRAGEPREIEITIRERRGGGA
ncbi:MAG TPA: S1C family serine protease [Gemmatimonadaceae bacterium]